MAFKQKGQGALEYLLIIGGALVIAAVVVTVLSSSGGAGGNSARVNAQNAICTLKSNIRDCVMTQDGYGCVWNDVSKNCSEPADCDQIGKSYNGTTYSEPTGTDGTDNLSQAQRQVVCATNRIPSSFGTCTITGSDC